MKQAPDLLLIKVKLPFLRRIENAKYKLFKRKSGKRVKSAGINWKEPTLV